MPGDGIPKIGLELPADLMGRVVEQRADGSVRIFSAAESDAWWAENNGDRELEVSR